MQAPEGQISSPELAEEDGAQYAHLYQRIPLKLGRESEVKSIFGPPGQRDLAVHVLESNLVSTLLDDSPRLAVRILNATAPENGDGIVVGIVYRPSMRKSPVFPHREDEWFVAGLEDG